MSVSRGQALHSDAVVSSPGLHGRNQRIGTVKSTELVTTTSGETENVDVGHSAAAGDLANVVLEFRSMGVLIKLNYKRSGRNVVLLEQQVLDVLGVWAVRFGKDHDRGLLEKKLVFSGNVKGLARLV